MLRLKGLRVAVIGLALSSFIFLPVQAFVIKKIDITGANLTEHSAVLRVMKLSLGENLSTQKANQVIRSLYNTGLYEDVRLARRGGALLVQDNRNGTSDRNLGPEAESTLSGMGRVPAPGRFG